MWPESNIGVVSVGCLYFLARSTLIASGYGKVEKISISSMIYVLLLVNTFEIIFKAEIAYLLAV